MWSATPHGKGFAFAIRHHDVFTENMGLELRRSPPDLAFRYFFQHIDVA
jgi:hypothetical protein